MDAKKTVVVVGASFGGLATAKELATAKGDKLHVVLVDRRDYLDLNFGSPRVLVKPEEAQSLVYPLSSLPWMKKCTFVQAVVKSIDKTHIEFEGRDDMKYDFCVICTGAPSLRRTNAYSPRFHLIAAAC